MYTFSFAYGVRDLSTRPDETASDRKIRGRIATPQAYKSMLKKQHDIQWMEEILHQLVNRLSHYNPIICSGS